MIAPLPWSFSICDIAAASNLAFSSVISHLGGGSRNLSLHDRFSRFRAGKA
jgi:hypothetical protein